MVRKSCEARWKKVCKEQEIPSKVCTRLIRVNCPKKGSKPKTEEAVMPKFSKMRAMPRMPTMSEGLEE
jgi:hypothetical protein